MTREQAEKYIRWSIAGNSEDYFRRNDHLHLVLRLMYYSHVKQIYIHRLTPGDIKRKNDGSGLGSYVPQRSGKYKRYFAIREAEMTLIDKYIKEYKVGLNEPIIQVIPHAVRKVFNEISEVYKVPGQPKPQLKEIYYAGLDK